MYSKLVNEQIELLKKNGMLFRDEEAAKKIIFRENFYSITSKYDDIFLNLKKSTKENEVYAEETYFEELYAIYKFDRELRNLIFDYINLLEINVKSYMSYIFTEKYGEKDVLNRNNFEQDNKLDKRFNRLVEEINRNLEHNKKDKNSDVQKFLKENGYLPLYVLGKVFSLGNTTSFYSLMKLEDRQAIAQNLNIAPHSLEKYLRMLNLVRNICAHGDILFTIKTYMSLDSKDYKYHAKLGIPIHNNKYRSGDNDLFAIMIVLKRLISKYDFDKMFIKIENMLNDLKSEIDFQSYENLLDYMGFPENYEKLNELDI